MEFALVEVAPRSLLWGGQGEISKNAGINSSAQWAYFQEQQNLRIKLPYGLFLVLLQMSATRH